MDRGSKISHKKTKSCSKKETFKLQDPCDGIVSRCKLRDIVIMLQRLPLNVINRQDYENYLSKSSLESSVKNQNLQLDLDINEINNLSREYTKSEKGTVDSTLTTVSLNEALYVNEKSHNTVFLGENKNSTSEDVEVESADASTSAGGGRYQQSIVPTIKTNVNSNTSSYPFPSGTNTLKKCSVPMEAYSNATNPSLRRKSSLKKGKKLSEIDNKLPMLTSSVANQEDFLKRGKNVENSMFSSKELYLTIKKTERNKISPSLRSHSDILKKCNANSIKIKEEKNPPGSSNSSQVTNHKKFVEDITPTLKKKPKSISKTSLKDKGVLQTTTQRNHQQKGDNILSLSESVSNLNSEIISISGDEEFRTAKNTVQINKGNLESFPILKGSSIKRSASPHSEVKVRLKKGKVQSPKSTCITDTELNPQVKKNEIFSSDSKIIVINEFSTPNEKITDNLENKATKLPQEEIKFLNKNVKGSLTVELSMESDIVQQGLPYETSQIEMTGEICSKDDCFEKHTLRSAKKLVSLKNKIKPVNIPFNVLKSSKRGSISSRMYSGKKNISTENSLRGKQKRKMGRQRKQKSAFDSNESSVPSTNVGSEKGIVLSNNISNYSANEEKHSIENENIQLASKGLDHLNIFPKKTQRKKNKKDVCQSEEICLSLIKHEDDKEKTSILPRQSKLKKSLRSFNSATTEKTLQQNKLLTMTAEVSNIDTNGEKAAKSNSSFETDSTTKIITPIVSPGVESDYSKEKTITLNPSKTCDIKSIQPEYVVSSELQNKLIKSCFVPVKPLSPEIIKMRGTVIIEGNDALLKDSFKPPNNDYICHSSSLKTPDVANKEINASMDKVMENKANKIKKSNTPDDFIKISNSNINSVSFSKNNSLDTLFPEKPFDQSNAFVKVSTDPLNSESELSTFKVPNETAPKAKSQNEKKSLFYQKCNTPVNPEDIQCNVKVLEFINLRTNRKYTKLFLTRKTASTLLQSPSTGDEKISLQFGSSIGKKMQATVVKALKEKLNVLEKMSQKTVKDDRNLSQVKNVGIVPILRVVSAFDECSQYSESNLRGKNSQCYKLPCKDFVIRISNHSMLSKDNTSSKDINCVKITNNDIQSKMRNTTHLNLPNPDGKVVDSSSVDKEESARCVGQSTKEFNTRISPDQVKSAGAMKECQEDKKSSGTSIKLSKEIRCLDKKQHTNNTEISGSTYISHQTNNLNGNKKVQRPRDCSGVGSFENLPIKKESVANNLILNSDIPKAPKPNSSMQCHVPLVNSSSLGDQITQHISDSSPRKREYSLQDKENTIVSKRTKMGSNFQLDKEKKTKSNPEQYTENFSGDVKLEVSYKSKLRSTSSQNDNAPASGSCNSFIKLKQRSERAVLEKKTTSVIENETESGFSGGGLPSSANTTRLVAKPPLLSSEVSSICSDSNKASLSSFGTSADSFKSEKKLKQRSERTVLEEKTVPLVEHENESAVFSDRDPGVHAHPCSVADTLLPSSGCSSPRASADSPSQLAPGTPPRSSAEMLPLSSACSSPHSATDTPLSSSGSSSPRSAADSPPHSGGEEDTPPRLASDNSPLNPLDTSSDRTDLAIQVCEFISELRKLDNTTVDALNNYKKSINEQVYQQLKAIILREALTRKTHPDRPPDWFLKFIANFRKQELWKLHQMFKIHDHLMRTESTKLNMLEKMYDELVAKGC